MNNLFLNLIQIKINEFVLLISHGKTTQQIYMRYCMIIAHMHLNTYVYIYLHFLAD